MRRRLFFALALTTLAATLSDCPFFTRDDSEPPPSPSGAAQGEPAGDHQGHDHE